jgi:hypothetical protein
LYIGVSAALIIRVEDGSTLKIGAKGFSETLVTTCMTTQGVPGGKLNILGGHSIGHFKKKSLYEHVSYSERFPIFGWQYFKFGEHIFLPSYCNAPIPDAYELV